MFQTRGLCSADEEAEHAELANYFIKGSFPDEEFFSRIRYADSSESNLEHAGPHTKSVKGRTRNHERVALPSGGRDPILLRKFIRAHK